MQRIVDFLGVQVPLCNIVLIKFDLSQISFPGLIGAQELPLGITGFQCSFGTFTINLVHFLSLPVDCVYSNKENSRQNHKNESKYNQIKIKSQLHMNYFTFWFQQQQDQFVPIGFGLVCLRSHVTLLKGKMTSTYC